MREIDDIIVSHLHGEASLVEVKRLFDWIRLNPDNAKEFARATMLNAQLREQLSGERQARESGELPVTNVSDSTAEFRYSRLLNIKSVIVVAVLAMSFLLGVGFWLSQGDTGEQQIVDSPPASESFATIVQTIDAVWDGSNGFLSGDRSSATALNLKSGFVRLQLDSGVEVTLEGPAKFELISAKYAKFHSGLLTSTVPPGAEGFRIDTPTAQVVDLGTAFGIELAADGGPDGFDVEAMDLVKSSAQQVTDHRFG